MIKLISLDAEECKAIHRLIIKYIDEGDVFDWHGRTDDPNDPEIKALVAIFKHAGAKVPDWL